MLQNRFCSKDLWWGTSRCGSLGSQLQGHAAAKEMTCRWIRQGGPSLWCRSAQCAAHTRSQEAVFQIVRRKTKEMTYKDKRLMTCRTWSSGGDCAPKEMTCGRI